MGGASSSSGSRPYGVSLPRTHSGASSTWSATDKLLRTGGGSGGLHSVASASSMYSLYSRRVCVYCASACASPNLTHAHWSRFVAALTARHGLTWTTQPLACVTPSPARPASIVTSAHPHDPTLTLAFLAQPHSGRLASPFHHALQPAIASIINITTSAATQPACRWHLSTRSLRTMQVTALVADDERCVFAKYHTSHMRVLRVRS